MIPRALERSLEAADGDLAAMIAQTKAYADYSLIRPGAARVQHFADIKEGLEASYPELAAAIRLTEGRADLVMGGEGMNIIYNLANSKPPVLQGV